MNMVIGSTELLVFLFQPANACYAPNFGSTVNRVFICLFVENLHFILRFEAKTIALMLSFPTTLSIRLYKSKQTIMRAYYFTFYDFSGLFNIKGEFIKEKNRVVST